MRFPKAMFADVVLFLVAATLLVIPAFAQHNESTRVGLPHDWSFNHLVFTNAASPDIVAHPERVTELANDPRFLAHIVRNNVRRAALVRGLPGPVPAHRKISRPEIDWAISLGSGTVNINQFPAKYTFDVSASPDCVHDYAVFPVNVAGSASQPNIVGFNYLYSGGALVTDGLCNIATPATPIVTGSTYSAAVYFSYNVSAIGGAVLTSPVISLDGSKIAFVESAAGSPPHFHVLAFNPGDGVSANPVDVTHPAQVTSFVSNQPAAGQATDLSYSPGCSSTGNGNSNSPPFVDYANDVAYVGDDCGNLVKINHVFCPSGCTNQPALDTSLNGGSATFAACTTASHTTLTGPVFDSVTGYVFVGCSDGNMYRVVPGSPATATHQNGGGSNLTNQGGINDPPLVDSGPYPGSPAPPGWVYWLQADNGATPPNQRALMIQSTTGSFSSLHVISLGTGNKAPLHTPTFNDPYFDSGVSTNWAMFACTSTLGGTPELSEIQFSVGRIIVNAVNGNTNGMGSTVGAACSPITDFLGGDGSDRIFLGVNSGVVNMFQVGTSSSNTYTASTPATTANESGGTSGIIVDNNSILPHASSFYFATLGGNTAVKLTDSTLQ